MSYKIKQLIYSELRKLKNKSLQKHREVDKIDEEIKELEKKLEEENE